MPENKINNVHELVKLQYDRCKVDPIYFIKTFCCIRNPATGQEKFNLYPFQEKLLKIILKGGAHDNIIINKSRQLGISTLMAAYALWEIVFQPDREILVIATKRDVAINLIDKVKYMYDNLPAYLLGDAKHKSGKKGDNIESYNKQSIVLRNKSKIFAVAASGDAGRSYSPNLLIIDEAAHIEDIDTIYTAIKPALTVAGRCIALSSPNGQSNWFYRTYTRALIGRNNTLSDKKSTFLPIELKWNVHPDRDQAWFDRESADMSEQEIAQEFNCDFLASGNTVVAPAHIASAEKNVCEPMLRRELGNDLWIWQYPMPKRKYLIACLPPDEIVLTDSGIKKISDVALTDKLINQDGKYVNIINKQIHNVIDEDVYEISVDNTFRTTKFTKEHPILSSRPVLKRNYNKNSDTYKLNQRYWEFDFKFTKSENLNIHDWVKVPNIYTNVLSNDDINSKWAFDVSVRRDFTLTSPLLNTDFWWFVGMWLGDGWLNANTTKNSYGVSICFNKLETYYLDKCKLIIHNIFDRHPSLIDKGSVYELKFSCKELYQFLKNTFGEYSYGKKISEWVKLIPNEYKINLIKGYFDSDGCWVKVNKHNKIHSKISFVSINLEMLESIQDILFSIGIISGLRRLKSRTEHNICGRICNTKECYDLSLHNYDSLKLINLFDYDELDIKINKYKLSDFNNTNKRIISSCHLSDDNKWIYFKITKIHKSSYTGTVYNFECDTHTFMCHHITTHNCDVARGDGNDYSTFHVIDTTTNEQVAEFQSKVSPTDFTRILLSVAFEYNEALLIVENNGLSYSVVEQVVNSNYPNTYYTTKGGMEMIYNEFTKKYLNSDKVPGFTNSPRVRPILVSKIQEYFKTNSIIIRSARTILELKSFIWYNGKAQADKGANDDLVIALGIALFIRDTHAEFIQGFDDVTRVLLQNTFQYRGDQTINTGRFQQNPYEMKLGNGYVEDFRWVLGN